MPWPVQARFFSSSFFFFFTWRESARSNKGKTGAGASLQLQIKFAHGGSSLVVARPSAIVV